MVLTLFHIRVYTLTVPLQQTTFEIIVAKGEIWAIAPLPQQLFSIILLSFIEIIYVLYLMISKSVWLNIIEINVVKGEIADIEQSWRLLKSLWQKVKYEQLLHCHNNFNTFQ